MELLKNKILECGIVLGDNILKVDSFLNHQIDVPLMRAVGKEFAEKFKNDNITKIVTLESSGIAPAFAAAEEMGVDVVFSRKNQSLTLNKNSTELVYSEVFSFTKNVTSTIYISRKHILPGDNILIIDDFLANGEACKGLISLIQDLGATVAGIGIVIEKSFQKGRSLLEEQNIKVVSLSQIKSLKNNTIEFLN